MRFTRGKYPGIEKYPHLDSPCWRLESRWFGVDLDINTRFPYGFSLGADTGEKKREESKYSFRGYYMVRRGPLRMCLDVNPPLEEPNRLYLTIGRWHVIIGLPSFRDTEVVSREVADDGHNVVNVKSVHRWWPHLDGVSRYKYHQDADGRWHRNATPEPFHWGWLTIERRC